VKREAALGMLNDECWALNCRSRTRSDISEHSPFKIQHSRCFLPLLRSIRSSNDLTVFRLRVIRDVVGGFAQVVRFSCGLSTIETIETQTKGMSGEL
jgi:hypothetical protein